MVSAGQRTQLFWLFVSNAIGRIGGNLWGAPCSSPRIRGLNKNGAKAAIAKQQSDDDQSTILTRLEFVQYYTNNEQVNERRLA